MKMDWRVDNRRGHNSPRRYSFGINLEESKALRVALQFAIKNTPKDLENEPLLARMKQMNRELGMVEHWHNMEDAPEPERPHNPLYSGFEITWDRFFIPSRQQSRIDMRTYAQLTSEAGPLIELLPCKCDTASHGGYECPRCQWLRERWILDIGEEAPFNALQAMLQPLSGVKPV